MRWGIKITPKEDAPIKSQTGVRLTVPRVYQTTFHEKLSKSFLKSSPISFNCSISAVPCSIKYKHSGNVKTICYDTFIID